MDLGKMMTTNNGDTPELGKGEEERGYFNKSSPPTSPEPKRIILGNPQFIDLQDKYDKLKKDYEELKKESLKRDKRATRLIKERDMLMDKIRTLEEQDSLSSSSDSDNDRKIIKINRPITTTPTTISRPMSTAPTDSPKKKPTQRRAKTGSKQTRRVQPLELDENGNVKLPVQIGILTVLDIGDVVWERDTFHNERYIWPVGYRVQRFYASTIDVDSQTCYTCFITDGEAADKPNDPIIANTATGAWTTVVRLSNAIRRRDHSNSASGPDYFGFSHPTIAKLIQDLPNADKCTKYVWQDFELMSLKSSAINKRYNVPSMRPRPPPEGAGESNDEVVSNGDSILLENDTFDSE